MMQTALEPNQTQPAAPADFHRVVAIWASVVILLGSSLMLFARLGHYPLWDDEAITAMTARGVWKTGDTSALVDDHNVLAYRSGLLTRDFKDRYTPPLQFYVIAPFIGLFGESDFVCRLPFAICGLITVGVMLRWLWRYRPPPLVWWTAIVVILSNAEFFLFFRQCRYYGLAMMLTTCVAYFYFHHNGSRRSTILLSLALVTLLASQYLNYAAVVGCLVVDYALWGRKQQRFTITDWAIVLLPQLIAGVIVLSIWNPVARGAGAYESGRWLSDRFHLLGWNWRDMLASDFVIPPLLALCPLLYFSRRNTALLRAPAALVVYIGALTVFVGTDVSRAGNAEIRYLAPVLPICIAIAIVAVWEMAPWRPRITVVVLAITALSTFVQFPTGASESMFGSTTLLFYNELIHPQREPYTPVTAWIKSNVRPGESIYIRPDWMVYPLMFRAGHAIYAWQISDPPKPGHPEFRNLPDIHFEGRVAPEFMIGFGPWRKEIGQAMDKLADRGVRYELVDTIKVYWQDLYRPERVWRSFVTKEPKEGEDIVIYRRATRSGNTK